MKKKSRTGLYCKFYAISSVLIKNFVPLFLKSHPDIDEFWEGMGVFTKWKRYLSVVNVFPLWKCKFPWVWNKFHIPTGKCVPPCYEAIFHFPRLMENYYKSGERLFLANKTTKSKNFLSKDRKGRDLNRGPLDLRSDALPTELSGLGRNSCQSLEI